RGADEAPPARPRSASAGADGPERLTAAPENVRCAPSLRVSADLEPLGKDLQGPWIGAKRGAHHVGRIVIDHAQELPAREALLDLDVAAADRTPDPSAVDERAIRFLGPEHRSTSALSSRVARRVGLGRTHQDASRRDTGPR